MCPYDTFKRVREDRGEFLLPLKLLRAEVEEGGPLKVDADLEEALETDEGQLGSLDELRRLVQQELCCERQEADKELSDLLPPHILQKISSPKVVDLTDEGDWAEDKTWHNSDDPELQEDPEEDVDFPFPETSPPISQNFRKVVEDDGMMLDALEKLQLPRYPSISRKSPKTAKINLSEMLLAAKVAKVPETSDSQNPEVCCTKTPPPRVSSFDEYVFQL